MPPNNTCWKERGTELASTKGKGIFSAGLGEVYLEEREEVRMAKYEPVLQMMRNQ